jgi:predicted nucleic acid-binding protein
LGFRFLSLATWIGCRYYLFPTPIWIQLIKDLGPGETETITLGLENPGSLVILDDLLGRRAARSAGLRVSGTLGVLLKAKRVGHLPSVAEAVADLRAAGMWIADELAENVITQAGDTQTR